MELHCKACGEGTLSLKTKERQVTHLEVYIFIIKDTFLSCNVCDASIITKQNRKDHSDQINFCKNQLFYL